MAEYTKDPNDVLDYDKDWTDFLNLVSPADTISTSTWTLQADNPDTSLTIGVTAKTGAVTKVWLSGGAVGFRYGVTNRIVTAGGRTKDETDYFTIEEH